MARHPAVYILASRRNGSLYVGVTADLIKRVWHHRNVTAEGFASRYAVHKLVYFEFYDTILEAVSRQKRLTGWHRAWKLKIIEDKNPQWCDLWDEIIR